MVTLNLPAEPSCLRQCRRVRPAQLRRGRRENQRRTRHLSPPPHAAPRWSASVQSEHCLCPGPRTCHVLLLCSLWTPTARAAALAPGGQSTLVGPIARGSSRFPAQGELGGKEAMVPQIISKSAVIKRVREERNRILFSALNTEK
ncbi:unnamed protein product [Gadus morhua 'NCC']